MERIARVIVQHARRILALTALVTITAAAPEAGITISSFRSGSLTISDVRTSSVVRGVSWKIAAGFRLALRRCSTAILARAAAVSP